MYTLLDERGLSPTLMATYCAERSREAARHLADARARCSASVRDCDLVVLERGDFAFDEAAIVDRPELRWSPYHGRRMRARVAATVLRGAADLGRHVGAGETGHRPLRPASDDLSAPAADPAGGSHRMGAFALVARHIRLTVVPPGCTDPRTLELVRQSLTNQFHLPPSTRMERITMQAGGWLAFRFVCEADLDIPEKDLPPGPRPGTVHYISSSSITIANRSPSPSPPCCNGFRCNEPKHHRRRRSAWGHSEESNPVRSPSNVWSD